MTKILLWIGLVVVLLLGLRLLNIARTRRRSGTTGGPVPPPAETMIRCAGCGTYLPQKDAIAGPSGPTCGDPACVQRH